MRAVEFVYKPLAQFNECTLTEQAASKSGPIGRMQVLHHIDAISIELRIQMTKRLNHICHLMAPVIKHHIRSTKLFQDTVEKFCIGLIANTDSDLILGERSAVRLDIQANYLRMRP